MRNISLIKSFTDNLPPIIDITDQLPKKNNWDNLKSRLIIKGKWDGVTYRTGPREPEEIDTIVIHHAPPTRRIEVHAKNHSFKWGAGVCYHIGIDRGQIKQLNDLLAFTYHVGGHNTYTVGIVVNRDLREGDLTSLERELLYGAILSVKAILPIKHIKGHGELDPTQCPCTSMNRIRADVMTLEQKLIFENSEQYAMETAYRVANQSAYLYGLMKNGSEGEKIWARKQLLKGKNMLA